MRPPPIAQCLRRGVVGENTNKTRPRNIQHDSNSTTNDADSDKISRNPSRGRKIPDESKPPSRSLSIRPTLNSRDNNAMMRAPKQGAHTKGGNATMPIHDKNSANRPLVPTLSATAKPSGRTPLTPRVAAPSAASTPLPRRGARVEANVTPIGGGLSQDHSTVSSTSSYLPNVTPRSGSRKTRVDSAGTTPNGTPTPISPRGSVIEPRRASHQEPAHYNGGLGIHGAHGEHPKRSTVHFGPALEVGGHRSQADSKFFHASDAKPTNQPSRQQRPPTSNKAPNFYYASGESIPPLQKKSPSVAGSAVGSSLGEERSQPRFLHANGTPDLHPASPHYFPPPGSGISPASSTLNSPRLTAPTSASRPASPQKQISRKGSTSSILSSGPSPLPSPGITRPGPQGRTQSTHGIPMARKVSVETPPRPASHGRTVSNGSFQSIDSTTERKRQSTLSTIEAAPLSSPSDDATFNTSMSDDTAHSEKSESIEEEVGEEVRKEVEVAAGEILKAGGTLEQMNELAANARRERKVLDLEITIQSLEATNRTLEREMRKQTAELRRFQRLSRSGRLSIATPNSHPRSADESQLSAMSEEEEDEEEDSLTGSDDAEDADSDTGDINGDGGADPAALAESDARHRKKDEKRLQHELSKHQQLLLDSQRMNMSLKRCIDWTEDLIADGRKALEYRVHVDEVHLGGRVLAPDEVEARLKAGAAANTDGDNDGDVGDDGDGDTGDEGLSDIGAAMLRSARSRATINTDKTHADLQRQFADLELEIDSIGLAV